LGVVAVITPWNFPLLNFVWGVAQNLIVGNVVVYKTSEECPLFGKLLERIVNILDCLKEYSLRSMEIVQLASYYFNKISI